MMGSASEGRRAGDVWEYKREQAPTYKVVAQVEASSSPVCAPVFYNCDVPPEADTQWPLVNAAPGLRLLRYRNIHVYPRHVLVDPKRSRVLPVSFKKHRHHAHNGVIHQGDDQFLLRDASLRGVRPKQVWRPLYVADTEYPGIYGHDLIEVLTAAWAWRDSERGSLFATSTAPRPYLVEMLKAVGVREKSMLFFSTPLRSRDVLFPEAAIVARRYVHPVAFELFDRVRFALSDDVPSPKRIYISRHRVGERPLENEAVLEELATRQGFQVVHPQELTIREQVTMFSHAQMIMGTGGSAMHNAVFAPATARVLIVSSPSWLTVIDSLLDNGRDRLGYVIGRPTKATPHLPRRNKAPWTVDPSEVEGAMRQHFGLQ